MDEDKNTQGMRNTLETPQDALANDNPPFPKGRPRSHTMERSFSQDIQEGTKELKEAAEQTRNIILDLGLDGVIRWVSPSWADVVGTQLEMVKGQPISRFIEDNPDVFTQAIQSLKSDNSKSKFVKFSVRVGQNSDLGKMLPAEQKVEYDKESTNGIPQPQLLALEGQGIMVYDRKSGGESHTMWMLQPAAEPLHITIALPRSLVDTLGVGAEVLAKHLTGLAESGGSDPAHHPPPLPILCRICERSIVPWWFEKHSDLCVQEHKAEMDVQITQENLAEHRHAIVKMLDALEVHRNRGGEQSPAPAPPIEYKGLPIGPTSSPSSGASSNPTSHPATPIRSRSPAMGLGHARARSFAVRRPLTRILELILDLCDTALEIGVPGVNDTKNDDEDDFRTQAPLSETQISRVLEWQQPTILEQEPGLAALSADTERMARAKVEAVHRHRVIIEYSERIRQEYMAEVDACVAEALEKAERAQAGELLSSSESELEAEGEDTADNLLHNGAATVAHDFGDNQPTSQPGLRTFPSGLRNTPDVHLLCHDQRRSSSAAVSSRSSSPLECPTPRSHRGTLINQNPPMTKRNSIYADSDANDSDSSLALSALSGAAWRTESPASENALSRTGSSRDRKRRSLHLHGLGSGSPRRQPSPARYPQPPPSPMRVKPRLPSGESMPSPIVSPLLTAGEFMPHNTSHHRRPSSVHASDIRPPSSPHLSSVSIPQPRVQPPSIKDFEIIKPISKGAFGSVYLAKKKLTGEYFAIKVLRKSDMVAKNQVTNVKAERAIMMWQGESDFVAKLYWTFSSKDYLYLVMEYLNGGDCAALVKILGGLPEDWAKKYIAEVVLGVEHLHSRGIVHRDLKPDNLLIDSKGHLKLTDFGLSRMGLVGRQKRVLKSPDIPAPDLLKQGPFTRTPSTATSRSASFDFLGTNSPSQTPLMTPALNSALEQPSYFNLNRENSSNSSKEPSRKTSGHRSDSNSVVNQEFHNSFRNISLHDITEAQVFSMPPRNYLVEEESYSQGSASPDLFPLSLSMSNVSQAALPISAQMLPPPMALFDPEDNSKRFVGTPDYLAPETINGTGQDEMSDWWSLGCILFEFLYGVPPFYAETTDEVFDNILNRRIAWPKESDEIIVSNEAKDLIDKLIQVDPRQRLGANTNDSFTSGGAEIKAHSWFSDINWDTLLEDEAQFIPNPENPEDTEYFDPRGATLQSFPEELEDQSSPGVMTPGGTEYVERPRDALLSVRNQVNSLKRGLMPLHIPPHVARDSRSRRLSEPVLADDFGNFTFKNLPVLEKANKDIVNKMREEAMLAQSRGVSSQAVTTSNTPAQAVSPGPALEISPFLPVLPLKRAISVSRGHQRNSPSGPTASNSSPSRPSQPASPLTVQYTTRQHQDRRKTSSSSQPSCVLPPGGQFEPPRDSNSMFSSAASSPIKTVRPPAPSPAKSMVGVQRQSSVSSRARSMTVGSQEGDILPEGFAPAHHKRRSQLFQDVSPSSSDNESNPQAKAILKVQRRRQSSRRLSQIPLLEGPMYRPLDVLVCEDHPVSKLVMERLFEKLRCRTISATNGPEALRLAVSQIKFDIIFMEYKLPLINGADVARMIRDTKSANTYTPIVAVTGYLKELPETHQFDTLIQKPATLAKLTEALCRYCQWKPPPKDLKPGMPLNIPNSSLRSAFRQDTQNTLNSPSSVASSHAPTMPESSTKASSRQNSIGSSAFGDLDSVRGEELPFIVSRQATNDWGRSGGLGISEDIVTDKTPYLMSGFPHLVHTESAPATATLQPSAKPGRDTPHRQLSGEDVKTKGNSPGKRDGNDEGNADSGDDEDEDEELGDTQVPTRSPLVRGTSSRQASKLGQEMMRTNSRGSVISTSEEARIAEPEALRTSIEILEARMESLKIPEELEPQALAATQPRKLERTASQHSHPEQISAVENRPPSRGHLTPPVMFPQKPGDSIKDIDMDGDLTPMPSRTVSYIDDEPTPRPQASPLERPLDSLG